MSPAPGHSGPRAEGEGGLWTERVILIVVAAVYLWMFTPDRPNGDGWNYINSVTAGVFVWNPNHLLFQPIGLLFAKLLAGLGVQVSTFVALKLLSALGAIGAVLLFHATLSAAGVTSRAARLAGTLGMFFSGYFVSLALAEEFFIIQMPLLAGVMLAAVHWIETRAPIALVSMGVLLALVNGIQINSAPLAVFLGLWVAWESRATGSHAWKNLAAVWGPGVAIGLPMLLLPYWVTSNHDGLLKWLTSYQGRDANDLSALYGIELTAGGIVKSAATLVYGFVQTFAGLGDLGTVGEALVTGRTLEFRPNVPLVVSTGLLFALLGVGMLGLAWWWWRTGRRSAIGRLAFVWLAAYGVFNFLWVDSADQFWAPILPPLWLLIVRAVSSGAPAATPAPAWRRRPAIALWAITALFALVNTGTVALFRSFTAVEANHAALLRALRPGDVMITTGWDDIVWLAWDDGAPYERITLMPLALQGKTDSAEMQRLPERVRAHLADGRRVLVARVFDRDREARPWEQMARLGWPRQRVVGLLSRFSRRSVLEIASVHIHELGPEGGGAVQPPRP